jgi:hypothetical protein
MASIVGAFWSAHALALVLFAMALAEPITISGECDGCPIWEGAPRWLALAFVLIAVALVLARRRWDRLSLRWRGVVVGLAAGLPLAVLLLISDAVGALDG